MSCNGSQVGASQTGVCVCVCLHGKEKGRESRWEVCVRGIGLDR